MKDENAARDERQIGALNEGMSGPTSGKGPTPTASSDVPGAFGDAAGTRPGSGVHVAEEQVPVFDEVGTPHSAAKGGS